MPYSFQGIGTMTSALRAFQTQIDVAGNNITNSETQGYHRQTVNLNQAPSSTVTVGASVSLGNGVNVASVTRVRDMFLAGRRVDAESKLGRQQEGLTGLSAIQSATMEPGDDGISAAYDTFMNSWSALSASPSSASARSDVQSAGQKLATKVSTLAQSLQSQRADNVSNMKDILGKIDAATAKISDLNDKIAQSIANGAEPNDLMDARDQAVQDLAGLADVSVGTQGSNVTVSLNGFRLVDASGSNPISGKFDMTTGKIVDGSSTYPVNGGSLAGAMDTQTQIDSATAQLDTFADTVRTQVNAIFSTGTAPDGSTGGSFFADPNPPATSITALGLRLSDPVAASANAIPSGASGLSGDGTLAAQISGLRDTKIAGLGNQTMGSYYSGMISGIGSKTAAAQDSVDTQQSVITQIDAQISGTDGVSMDDEMANLLRYQRAYQAAAKALSTFDSITGTLIDMLNR